MNVLRRLACVALMAWATAHPLSAQDATAQLLSQFRVQGDTLVHLAGGSGRPEIRYLLRTDTVMGISAAGIEIAHVVPPMQARVLRAIAAAVHAGTPLDPALWPDVLTAARTMFGTAPPGMRSVIPLKSGESIVFSGDTIRVTPAPGARGDARVFILTAQGASEISGGTSRRLPEEMASGLALLRMIAHDSDRLERLLNDLLNR